MPELDKPMLSFVWEVESYVFQETLKLESLKQWTLRLALASASALMAGMVRLS